MTQLFVSASTVATAVHVESIVEVVLALTILLAETMLGGHVAIRLGQPAVLGELLAGVVLGALGSIGVPVLERIRVDPTIEVLAQLGVILLLFEVGLESTVREMLQVGARALLIALLGVVGPFALGWGVGALLLPDQSVYVHVFLGATLTATSVGITARVLKDLGRSRSLEARLILGAAVIDDVLGLVILALVAGLIAAADRGDALTVGHVVLLVAKPTLFLVGALALGTYLSPRLFRLTSRLRGRGVLLATALAFCFVLAWLGAWTGLAPIVGAYAAGLILEEFHVREFTRRGEPPLEHLVQPLTGFLVPLFFVVMGMRVNLAAFAQPGVLGLAALLTVAAFAGKQCCSLGALGLEADALSIGLGMVPRGEVGLIFANVGLGLTVRGERIVDDSVYAAVVIVVIVTTLATPPALRWSLKRRT